jgi:serine O-acetyltransferase
MTNISLSTRTTDNIDRLSPLPFWQCIGQDAIAHIPPEARAMSGTNRFFTYSKICLFSSGFHLSLLCRLSYFAHMKLGIVGKIVAQILFWVRRHWYTCAIASTARIAGGVIFPHPQGIVIGAEASIGERTWIFQNVTIGGAPGKVGLPIIGNDCRIYTGAVIVGPIEIGEGVTIGANAVVAKSIPAHILVKSAPTVMVALTAD